MNDDDLTDAQLERQAEDLQTALMVAERIRRIQAQHPGAYVSVEYDDHGKPVRYRAFSPCATRLAGGPTCPIGSHRDESENDGGPHA